MPLNLLVGDSADFKIYVKTGTVPAGATFTASSSDPTSIRVATDPTPLPVSGGEGATATPPVPDGTPTVLSGTVSAIAPNATVGTAVTITVTQTNTDGTTLTLSDTVTPTATETLGDLFGTPVTSASQAANKAALGAHVIPVKGK